MEMELGTIDSNYGYKSKFYTLMPILPPFWLMKSLTKQLLRLFHPLVLQGADQRSHRRDHRREGDQRHQSHYDGIKAFQPLGCCDRTIYVCAYTLHSITYIHMYIYMIYVRKCSLYIQGKMVKCLYKYF